MRTTMKVALLSRISSSPEPTFAPTDISGLELWLDASDLTTLFQDAGTTPVEANDDPVGGWRDKSANARLIAQATAANKPLVKLAVQNGKAGVRSDGSNDWMRVLSVTTTQPFSVYIAWIPHTVSDGRQFVSLGNAVVLNGSGTRLGANAGSTVTSASGLTANTAAIGIVVFNGAASVIAVNDEAGATVNPGTGNGDRIHLFSDSGANFFTTITLLELLIYSGAHDADTRASVRDYLNDKWQIYSP